MCDIVRHCGVYVSAASGILTVVVEGKYLAAHGGYYIAIANFHSLSNNSSSCIMWAPVLKE